MFSTRLFYEEMTTIEGEKQERFPEGSKLLYSEG